jgi:hypothetical protein
VIANATKQIKRRKVKTRRFKKMLFAHESKIATKLREFKFITTTLKIQHAIRACLVGSSNRIIYDFIYSQLYPDVGTNLYSN